MNLGITETEIDRETARIERALFPVLQAELTGAPQRLLDFGCGWGRFTAGLAACTGAAEALGYDPTAELIALADHGKFPGVRYVTGSVDEFFAASHAAFDLIWVHAVLGGIPDAGVPDAAAKLCGALAAGGMLFVIEDTSPPNPSNAFWRVREERLYTGVFSAAGLSVSVAGTMQTRFGEVKSIFAARKRP